MKYYQDYSRDEVAERIDSLVDLSRECMMQKGNKCELSFEVLYFMAIIDKSIKLIDDALFALKRNNVTVLAILTRVQMDCVFRAYALTLAEDRNQLAKEVLGNKKQMNQLLSVENKKFTDKYMAEKVGEWLKLPVYELYQKVCGFVHFSDANFHMMIDDFNQDGFSLLSFTKENPPGKEKEFNRLSLELANQFLFFGELLITSIFDSWVKQCLSCEKV